LFVASAFFSGSETALFSLSRLDLEKLRKERHPSINKLQQLLDQPRQLIISILCGNEIINVAAAVNMAGILVFLYGDSQAAVLNILIMVPLLLLLGEVTPKTIAVSDPVNVSTRLIVQPMSIWVKLVAPIRWLVRQVAERVTTFFVGEDKNDTNLLNIDEFRTLIDEVAKDGELSATEHSLVRNLLSAGTIEVVQIMIPRTRVTFIDEKTSLSDIIETFRSSKHSRLPVYRGNRDNLIGFLHAEDLVRVQWNETGMKQQGIEKLLHKLVVVTQTKKVDEMFDYLLHQKAQAAVVINEFGGVEGLVTMKSVLHYVFGHKGDMERVEDVTVQPDGSYEVPGSMSLTAFNNLTNYGLRDPRMTTVGGIVLRHLDHFPETGDQADIEGVRFEVIAMDSLQISLVKVSRIVELKDMSTHDNDKEGS
jgi:CBS domain containing-hemolysin-like protein